MPRINTYSDNASIENDDKMLTYDTQAAATKITAFSTIWNWIVSKLHALTSSSAALTPSTDRVLMDKNGTMTRVEPAAVAKYGIETYNGSTIAGQAQTVKSALDALNSKLTLTGEYNSAESFSSAETLGSKLDALLNAQGTYVIGCYRLSCTASFGVFQNGYDYYVQMARANSLNFVMAEFTPIDNGFIKILGKRRNEGWSFELAPSRTEIDTLNSNKAPKFIKLTGNASTSVTLQDTVAILFTSRDDSYQFETVNYWKADSLNIGSSGALRFSVNKEANSYNFTVTNLQSGNTTILMIG